MKAFRRRAWLCVALLLALAGNGHGGGGLPPGWESLPAAAAALAAPGERVALISARFLGVPYVANTLGGGPGHPEQLTIRLDAVDCFTLLDYVEALRRSTGVAEFPARLAEVRYRDGVIAWEQRRHFFTDWAAAPQGRVVDVTSEVGGSRVRQVVKQLNRGADGAPLLPGVAVQARPIHFIPGEALDAAVLGRLRTGDYVGIYTPAAGLDVTHVGIVIRREGRLLLRHASSRREAARVVDSDFVDYLAGKPGLVVLRPQ